MIKLEGCEEIFRMVNGELILAPLGRARLAGNWGIVEEETSLKNTRTPLRRQGIALFPTAGGRTPPR